MFFFFIFYVSTCQCILFKVQHNSFAPLNHFHRKRMDNYYWLKTMFHFKMIPFKLWELIQDANRLMEPKEMALRFVFPSLWGKARLVIEIFYFMPAYKCSMEEILYGVLIPKNQQILLMAHHWLFYTNSVDAFVVFPFFVTFLNQYSCDVPLLDLYKA